MEGNNMDPELIKHYAYELNWHLPEQLQQEAIEWLSENTPLDQLALIFPPYAKRCWQNAVKVIEAVGYPDNKTAFSRMVELFHDINWPGAEEAVLYFQTLEKSVVVPYIEAAAKQAIEEKDWQWLWFLYAVSNRLFIERADFELDAVFDRMKECYEMDE